MSTVVSNEAKNLPPRPVDPPGITGEQLLAQSTNKAADALKLKEKEDRIAGLKKKGAEDALKLKEKDKTTTKWKGIAGAFGILSLALASALVWKITLWQGFIVAYTLIFVYSSIVFLAIVGKNVTY